MHGRNLSGNEIRVRTYCCKFLVIQCFICARHTWWLSTVQSWGHRVLLWLLTWYHLHKCVKTEWCFQVGALHLFNIYICSDRGFVLKLHQVSAPLVWPYRATLNPKYFPKCQSWNVCLWFLHNCIYCMCIDKHKPSAH